MMIVLGKITNLYFWSEAIIIKQIIMEEIIINYSDRGMLYFCNAKISVENLLEKQE